MGNRERGKGRVLGTGPDPWLWAIERGVRDKGRALGTGPDPGCEQ